MKTSSVIYHINTLKNSYDHFDRCREKSDKRQHCFLTKTISLHVIKCVKTAFYGLNKDKLIHERRGQKQTHVYTESWFTTSTNATPLDRGHFSIHGSGKSVYL